MSITEGCGRLIDADRLKNEFRKHRDFYNYYGNDWEVAKWESYDMAMDEVDDAPTIIEASEKEEEGYKVGYKEGYNKGYKEGYNKGCEDGATYWDYCGAELEDDNETGD